MSKKYKADDENIKKLNEAEAQKPQSYNSSDKQAADRIARSLLSNKFSYDAQSDLGYSSAKKIYTENAKNAMNDTLGRASALSGGYANSWAVGSAQREYERVMSEFEDIIPELYSAAYGRYRDGIDDKFRLLDSYRESDKENYQRFRDEIKTWQDARNYYYKLVRDDIEDKQFADELEIDMQKLIGTRLKGR
ncbi:MAG: hypothetical protein PUB34_06465 [Clostridia bacterium]|nr:hypothetical protein [Clostridia bacterium]